MDPSAAIQKRTNEMIIYILSRDSTEEDATTDSNIISPTIGPSTSDKHSGCGNIIVYLVAPMASIIFALVVNTVVMAICKLISLKTPIPIIYLIIFLSLPKI